MNAINRNYHTFRFMFMPRIPLFKILMDPMMKFNPHFMETPTIRMGQQTVQFQQTEALLTIANLGTAESGLKTDKITLEVLPETVKDPVNIATSPGASTYTDNSSNHVDIPVRRPLMRIIRQSLIGLILIAPALYILWKNPNLLPNLDLTLSNASLLSSGQLSVEAQIVRWAMFISATWILSVSWWYFVYIFPTVFLFLVITANCLYHHSNLWKMQRKDSRKIALHA